MDVAEPQLKEASPCRMNRALKERQTSIRGVDGRPHSAPATQRGLLAFGIRPAGFVLINRTRLLAAKGISHQDALLIDQWVARAGGGLQPLRRAEPERARKHPQRTTRPDRIVWGVPA